VSKNEDGLSLKNEKMIGGKSLRGKYKKIKRNKARVLIITI
jgi:hypothetical protein